MQQQRERPNKPPRPRLSLAARLIAGIMTILGALGFFPLVVWLIRALQFGTWMLSELLIGIPITLGLAGVFFGGIAALSRRCILARWLWSVSALCCLVDAAIYYNWFRLGLLPDKTTGFWFWGFIGCATILGALARWIGTNAEE